MLEERMRENEAWWRRAAPGCEILYIGTPWIGNDIEGDLTRGQNAVVRSIAEEHGRAYVDLMQPTHSYDWLAHEGFMADETHLNYLGGLFTADLLWNDSGFFALGMRRSISTSGTQTGLQLHYTTSPSAIYRLEQSMNLKDWSLVLEHPLESSTITTNISTAEKSVYFRLSLSPPD